MDVCAERLLRQVAVKETCQEPLPDISEQSLFVSYDGSSSCGYAIPSTFGNVCLQTVCYYDDYSFRQLETTSLSNILMPMPLSDYDSFTDMTQGLLTSQREYLMPSATPSYIVKAYYYDERSRIVQTHSTNHLGGVDMKFLNLSFTGKPLKRKRMTAAGLSYQPLSVTEEYVYTYDHADRLITTTHSLNGATPVVLVSNEYDDLGRLVRTKPMNSNSLMTQYTYNVRSWPKTISSPLFSEALYYEDGTTPCWNGNISSMTWNADSILRRYNFQYDGLSRLTRADYQEQAGLNAWRFAANYTYDRHGNLTNINRRGWTMSLPGNVAPSLLSVPAQPEAGASMTEFYGTVDSLTATYNGNQLLAVSNAVTTPPMSTYGHANFVDGASMSEEYAYDANAPDRSEAEPVIHYTLVQNAEARTVTISYDLDASATVRCVLADSKGVVYRTAEQTNAAGTGYSLALSYSGLPHGQYVVYISAGGLTQAVKFSAK